MLMLAHTWILREFLGPDRYVDFSADIFAYNVFPDILPILKDITPAMTHALPRFRPFSPRYAKGRFLQFHLLVDDLAHYGFIVDQGSDDFNPHARGYAYVKGKQLIDPIIDLYRSLDGEINYGLAAYRAHMLIEMTFDQILRRKDDHDSIMKILCQGMRYAVEEKNAECRSILAWIYGIEEETISKALDMVGLVWTYEKLDALMNIEGRINLCIDKFGLNAADPYTRQGMSELVAWGMNLVDDYYDFLSFTLKTIKETGFTNTLIRPF